MENQMDIPKMGFGTYGRTGEDGIDAILCALRTGYRHLDTAQSYDTEYEVGEAFRRSGLGRDEVFMTTKISTDNFGKGQLFPSLESSLKIMGLVQADLTLIHWPSPNGAVPLEVYLVQLAEAQAQGLTRLIGVSNFTIALLKQAASILGKGRIVNNQFELNPNLQNKELATYCLENGISVTCYLPIARGRLASDPLLQSIARNHDATVEQVILAFEFAKGYCAIPTSARPERIRSNFEATKLTLQLEEIAQIEALDKNSRMIDPDWGPDWD
jgi:2,5-diketo-D-gluconate reductase B